MAPYCQRLQSLQTAGSLLCHCKAPAISCVAVRPSWLLLVARVTTTVHSRTHAYAACLTLLVGLSAATQHALECVWISSRPWLYSTVSSGVHPARFPVQRRRPGTAAAPTRQLAGRQRTWPSTAPPRCSPPPWQSVMQMTAWTGPPLGPSPTTAGTLWWRGQSAPLPVLTWFMASVDLSAMLTNVSMQQRLQTAPRCVSALVSVCTSLAVCKQEACSIEMSKDDAKL